MPFYTSLAPGVFVQEVPGAHTITPIGTSTGAVLGTAPDAGSRLNELVPVNNWSEFRTQFAAGDNYDPNQPNHLANAVNGFFANGGSRLFIANVKAGDSLAAALRLLETNDEVSMVLAPGLSDPLTHNLLQTHCDKMGDRVCILDPPPDVTNLELLKTVEAATIPAKAAKAKDKDAAAGPGPADKPPDGLHPAISATGLATFYFPWLYVADALSPKGELVECPPSGHMAGIWARVDALRGVHKAPANELVRGALDIKYRVTAEEQGPLNVLGVNIIRWFSKQGPMVWGARTLVPQDHPMKYLPVRRIMILINESIKRATRYVVFEPNDRFLWNRIKAEIKNFLNAVYKDGALAGRTPEEAFFVKCDEETNPQENIDMGVVTTVIGVAPVKPAEYVVFRIGQMASGAQIEAL